MALITVGTFTASSYHAVRVDRFPGTLKDLGRATLVSTRTLGKLLSGDLEPLPHGFELLYPFAEVLMPSGIRIEGVGVQPDVELSQRDTLDARKVLAFALRALDARTAPSTALALTIARPRIELNSRPRVCMTPSQ